MPYPNHNQVLNLQIPCSMVMLKMQLQSIKLAVLRIAKYIDQIQYRCPNTLHLTILHPTQKLWMSTICIVFNINLIPKFGSFLIEKLITKLVITTCNQTTLQKFKASHRPPLPSPTQRDRFRHSVFFAFLPDNFLPINFRAKCNSENLHCKSHHSFHTSHQISLLSTNDKNG